MSQPESDFKRQLKSYMERNGWFWSIIPEGTYGKPGDPDIVACINGRFVGIEAKTPLGQ